MRIAAAIAASLAFHLALAAALAFLLSRDGAPELKATLDYSSVELSFSEDDAQSEPPAQPSAASPQPAPPPTPTQPPTPPDAPTETPIPPSAPDTAAPPLPQPLPETLPPAPPAPPTAPAAPQDVQKPSPRQARVDAPARPKRTIRPQYPKESRLRREQGDVTLEVRVGAGGEAESVSVVSSSGFAALDAAAENAVRSARFSPAKSGGRSVASTARITLSFKLDKGGSQ